MAKQSGNCVDKVLIAGAGVGGLTTALALHRAGIEVSIFEKYPAEQKHTTGFSLWSYAGRQLEVLGLGPAKMKHVGCPIEQTEIRNQTGQVISRMPVGEVSRSLGCPSYETRRPNLLAALEAELPTGTVHRSIACIGARTSGDRAVLDLNDGTREEADLIVGADGIHSTLRSVVTGPAELRDSGYRGCSAVVAFSSDMLAPQTHVDIWGKGAKAGIGDVGDGLVRWYMTWKASQDKDRQTRSQLLEAHRKWDPLLNPVVEATDEEQIVHHTFSDLPPIQTWHEGRVVLLGDAAHATTPFAAMGANMTIEDSVILARDLTSGVGVDEALQSFQDSRKKRTEDVVAKGRTMARLTQLHSSFAAWLRDQAFLHMPAEDTERVTREMASG